MKDCNFESVTLFTSALCNLNCKYCYICKDKTGCLKQIDKDLEEDFKNRAQLKSVLNYHPKMKDNLCHITLWGGEPTLHLERFIDQVEDWFEAFPNLKGFDISTNFTIPGTIPQFERMLDKVSKCYDARRNNGKKFEFDLQMSIDGYRELNDFNRGQGTTDKFLKNYKELLKIKYDQKNINIIAHTKPTLAKETFHFLDTKEKVYKWFEFLDQELGRPWIEAGEPFIFFQSMFNCAQPAEWTQEDGYEFAKLMENIYNLTPKIKKNLPSWSNVETFIPMANLTLQYIEQRDEPIKTLDQLRARYRKPDCGGTCGVFTGQIVPIHGNKFTMCHRGLYDAYVDYYNDLLSRTESLNGLTDKFYNQPNLDWTYTKEEYHEMEEMLTPCVFCANNRDYTDLIIQIREQAFAGIIDPKYKNVEEIENTLGYFMGNSYCVQDAFLVNGSYTTRSMLEVPLLYNGAMDVALKEIERIMEERQANEFSRRIE